MAVPKIDPLELEGSKGGRGGRENRAPAGFKKAVEEIAQIIFSKTKISVEGAAKSVVPSIPKMIQQISDDIRTGSIEKFKVSLDKLENIIDKLGLDLGKYNKNLANFIQQRQEKLIKSEEQISEIREKGAKAEINQITGEIQFLSREEIKQRRDTLKETLIEMKNVEKIKTKQEKQLQESRFLSEEEIKSKKQFVSQSYETLKTLETNKQNLMKTLNIQSEEDLPSTGLFSGFNRKGNERQSGEGIREYIPNFLLEITDTFKSQITGFFEPLLMLKDIFLDILKPLKIFKKLLMPIISGMKKLALAIGRQIKTGLALVAVNLLRILTDKRVLIGLAAIAGLLFLNQFKDGPDGPKKGSAGDIAGEAADPSMYDTVPDLSEVPEEETRVKGTKGMLGLSSEPQTSLLKIEKGERVLNRAETNAYNRNEALGIDERKENASLLGRKATTSSQANVGVNTNVSNVQTQNTSSVSNLSTGSVTNNGNAWFNQVASF
jgi:hypothetical protein